MYLYRVVEKDKYVQGKVINGYFEGVNTFAYNNIQDYLHFFVLPESAEIYQQLKYKNANKESVVLKCDIPYSFLKDNFGVGMYSWYKLKAKSPFLEVRLNKFDFENSMVIEVADKVKEEWKNEAIYNRYLNKVIYGSSVNRDNPISITFDSNFSIHKVELKPTFNFLNYFPLDQLKKENLENDYKEDIIEYVKSPYLNKRIEISNKTFLNRIKTFFNRKKRWL